MSLTGQLSDLSLAELIEFFCNQRKTGRLKVSYPHTDGYFYIQAGALTDARIGPLKGAEAVYYALTLACAQFEFNPSCEFRQCTIQEPWTRVILEGLRRVDEGVAPVDPFNAENISYDDEPEVEDEKPTVKSRKANVELEPLALTVKSATGGGRRMLAYALVVTALLLCLLAVGVPAGWYRKFQQKLTTPARNAPSVQTKTPQQN